MKKKKIIKILGKVDKFFNYYLKVIVALTFIFFSFIFATEFNQIISGNFMNRSELLIVISVIFATNIALATMVFTYSSNYEGEERDSLLRVGEKFVLSTVAFLLYLGIIGFDKTGYLEKLLNNIAWKIYIIWPLAVLTLLLLAFAFIYFLQGIWKLLTFTVKKNS